MTEKDKALEIFYKFNDITSKEFKSDTFTSATSAKRCALICCDEVISQWEYIDTYIGDGVGVLNPNLRYWKKVKKQIELL